MSQSVWGSLVFFLAHAASPAMLIAGDAALYQPKSLARDRVILHPLLNQLQFQR